MTKEEVALYTVIIGSVVALIKWGFEFFYKSKDVKIHKDLTASIVNNTSKANRIEHYLRIASEQFTTNLPAPILNDIAGIVFDRARYYIYEGTKDLIGSTNWNNKELRDKFEDDLKEMITNIYQQDESLLSKFTYNQGGSKVSELMQSKWVDKITHTCIEFTRGHFERGNGWITFKRSLKSDFVSIHNEFKKGLYNV